MTKSVARYAGARGGAETKAKEAATKAAADRAATLAAEQLAADIKAAEKDLETVDVKTATMAADPQSDSMAKAIGADQNLIAALSHAFFAIAIEFGSGVGFWLVFGHGAPNTRREEAQVSPPSTALVPIDRNGALELQVIDEKPEEIIERFFLEVVRPRLNHRVQSVAVWSAYKQWCADRGLPHSLACNVRSHGALAEGSAERSGAIRETESRAHNRIAACYSLVRPTAGAGIGSLINEVCCRCLGLHVQHRFHRDHCQTFETTAIGNGRCFYYGTGIFGFGIRQTVRLSFRPVSQTSVRHHLNTWMFLLCRIRPSRERKHVVSVAAKHESPAVP